MNIIEYQPRFDGQISTFTLSMLSICIFPQFQVTTTCADSAADLPGFEHSKGPPRSMQKGSRSPQRSGTHQAQNGLSFHQFSPVQLFEYFEWERLLSRWNAMFSNEPSSGAFQKPWLHGNLKSCERVTGQHLLQVGTLALALEHFWLPRGHTVPRNGTHQAVDPSMR